MSAKVKVYALSTCIHCRNCKAYLDEKKQPYDCVFVDLLTGDDRAKALDEVKKLNPKCSFPTVVIGDKVVVGFDKDSIDEALKD
jgi:glutaredoxin-like protein NrdH